jgi:hypothetical protein
VTSRVLLAAALLGALAGGCALRQRTPEPGPDEGEWALLRNDATRRTILYDGVTHRATATATHLSLAVREAQARRLAIWKSWTDAELERRLATERAAAASGEEFLVAFYTAQWKNNDLDSRDTIWRVSVRAGDNELLASEIHAVPVDAQLTNLFPWIGPFDTAYSVRFPRSPNGPLPDGGGFVLELASAVGKVELDWSLPRPKDFPELLPAPPERR